MIWQRFLSSPTHKIVLQLWLLRFSVIATLARLMKRTLLLVLPAIFLGTACERHSASSLPEHGGGHATEHSAAPAEPAHSAVKAPAPAAAAPAAEEAKKDAPAAKFFEQKAK